VGVLVLDVLEVGGSGRWRWRLSEVGGAFVADHEVRLDEGAFEFEGFEDLFGFVRWRADLDDRLASEARLVGQVGAWVGERVLGAVGRAMVDAAPVTVRVRVPAEAGWLVARPLELAHVGGVPLVLQGVTLVFEPAGWPTVVKEPVGERLRMLGLFSLPEGSSSLALRRERYELQQLIAEVAAVSGKAIELRVLQYGVTQQRLTEVLEEADGWDVIHFSGHGLPRGLVLEDAAGATDVVPADELVALLAPVREQIKLLVLSSCYSGAAVVTSTLQQLGVTAAADRSADGTDGDGGGAGLLPALADRLGRSLGCATVAMRFPVVDDFAVGLAGELYTLLLDRQQPLDRALQLMMPKVVADPPTPGFPALSVATPTVLGPAAVGLRLAAPDGPPAVFDIRAQKLADFPEQPPKFVGRSGPMTRASTALAPRSGRTGVVLHGMAGAGKTACALELAYTHQDSFGQLTWFAAPQDGHDIDAALAGLAAHLEFEWPGVQMVHVVDNAEEYARFLLALARLWQRSRLLLVVDNCESLLTGTGRWRDERWGQLVEALTAQPGLSRLVLTSRRLPHTLPATMIVEPVHALDPDDALLLARQLPNLGALMDGTADVPAAQGRQLVARTLAVVQGHPKLLELADGDAADPARLQARLDTLAADTTDGAVALAGLFDQGHRAGADRYLTVLDDWARTAADDLPDDTRDLFWLLCAVEEPDRTRHMLEGNFADLWRRLERDGEPGELDELLGQLTGRALIQLHSASHDDPFGDRYRLHPAVADSSRRQAGPDFQAAVDRELAAYWDTLARQALEQEASSLLALAGRRAAPYLLRLHEWDLASALLDRALNRDDSPAAVAEALPLLRRIADATAGTDRELVDAGVLAKTLANVDPAAAETMVRELVDRAVQAGRYDQASANAGNLSNLIQRRGRLAEALELADRKIGYTRQAGFGAWTQLGDEGRRLQILLAQGNAEQVAEEVPGLLERAERLPDQPGDNDRIEPYTVREGLLDTGRAAAQSLRRWDDALDYIRQISASEEARGAPELERTRTLFNAYFPLLRLGRTGDARQLLLACLDTFKAYQDLHGLGMTLSSLASVEDQRGHPQEAVDLQRQALRHRYANGDLQLTNSHHNLANYLHRTGGEPREVVAHRLAAATIYQLTGAAGELAGTLAALGGDLDRYNDQRPDVTPDTFEALCERVEQTVGVRYRQLIGQLTGPETDLDQLLQTLIDQAATLSQARAEFERHRERWQPIIPVIVAAAHGDQQALEELDPLLDELATSDDWRQLVAAIRQIIAGEPDPNRLLDGLDPIDTAILTDLLEQLEQPTPTHPDNYLPQFEPIIQAVATAAVDPSTPPNQQLEQLLTTLADQPDWTDLAGVLRRILAGERDPNTLLSGLDPIDTAIVTATLDRLPS
jgi:hypothetical protein